MTMSDDGTTTTLRDVINVNLTTFGFELQFLIQQGWEIHPNYPVSTWGRSYECKMVKSDKRVAQMIEYLQSGAPPKLSREEIMAKARAAKGINKVNNGLTDAA